MTEYKRNSHCSFCGFPFPANEPWPRTCQNCQQHSYLNPTPVAVVLLPVDNGLLTVRRDIEPQKGKLALPGGFIVRGESWQEAGAREVMEETGVTLDPAEIAEFSVQSAPDSTLLVFGLAKHRNSADLPPFKVNSEVSQLEILNEPTELAFSTHTESVRRYFAQKAADTTV